MALITRNARPGRRVTGACVALLAATALAAGPHIADAAEPGVVVGANVKYTSDADFDKGTLVNVNHDAPNSDQLQLNKSTGTFPFIWVALSARGTIAKINTETGAILGEYSTTADNDGSHNPSRTTVGLDGSVWAGNRNQSSVIHVGLKELNQCVDRNGDGLIATSSGYGNVLPWPSYGAADPVSTATDECILDYVDTFGGDARHVSVDRDGDVWVGNFNGSPHRFQKIDSDTGTIVAGSARDHACGGYGGLIDGNGVLWSATPGTGVLRWDPQAADSSTNPTCVAITNYGMAFDSQNNLWVSTLDGSGQVHKLSPAGVVLGTFPTGNSYAQGLAVDQNDHVWISSSLIGGANKIVHLLNDGRVVGKVVAQQGGPNGGSGSTGVSVDDKGKIWLANISSSDASRIDPDSGPFSTTPGLEDIRVGAFDLHVPLPGASPYNYSDMTGSALLGAAKQGSWSVVQDAGSARFDWATVIVNTEPQGYIPSGGSISAAIEVKAADSVAALGGESFEAVSNCGAVDVLGRYIQVRITLKANEAGESPILSDVTVRGGQPPSSRECEGKLDKKSGYALLDHTGAWYAFGEINFYGSASGPVTGPSGDTYNRPFVGGAINAKQDGYWSVGADGGVFAYGNAKYHGSLGTTRLNEPIVGMASNPAGTGYWLVARDGGVFSYGDAAFQGSTGSIKLNRPIVGMVATPTGKGYHLVAQDGGVFAFGDAVFRGSTGGIRLNSPIAGIASAPTGDGYWMVAEDGGVFAFGVPFRGSLGGMRLTAPITGLSPTPTGNGYVLAGEDGGIFAFGDAPFFGNAKSAGGKGKIIAVVTI